jgi:pectin methylesterase-like acyl-CoA thioesterase
VAVESGVILDAAGVAWDGSATDWSFATRTARPAATAPTLTVAADGTGDFCTVQGAIDFIRPNQPDRGRITILVRKGVYHELVDIPQGKNLITLRGEDRHASIIACANNAVVNPQHRTMMGVQADDITIQNLTLHNLTPKGGKQSETLQVRGARCLILDDDFFSFQDTLRLDGGVYVKNCFVAGDVDFIWGYGTVFFDHCTLRALNNGFFVQSRNNAQHVGYVFDHCTLETAPAATRVVLARIHPQGYPYSNVVFLSCRMGPGIVPEGWELDRGTDRDHFPVSAAAAATRPEGQNSAPVDNDQPAPNVHFWEYQSTDLAGQPVDVSHRLSVSRQLTAAEAAPLADPAKVLGAWVSPGP